MNLRKLVLPMLLLIVAGCTVNDSVSEQPRDPVCGKAVDRAKAIYYSYDRHPYWFDSEACLEKFLRHPASYVDMEYYIFSHND